MPNLNRNPQKISVKKEGNRAATSTYATDPSTLSGGILGRYWILGKLPCPCKAGEGHVPEVVPTRGRPPRQGSRCAGGYSWPRPPVFACPSSARASTGNPLQE